ncbi:hypothetical protein AgCh_015653 [Apium graveolens]
MGIWLCGVCFKAHTLRAKCRHDKGSDFVSPPDNGDDAVRFIFHNFTKPQASSEQPIEGLRTVKSIPPKCRLGFSRVLKGALDKVICKPDDISCWVSLFMLPLCILKTFCPRSNIECKSAIRRQRQEESIANVIRSWSVPGGSLHLARETLAENSPSLLEVDDEDLDLGEHNINRFKRKISDGHYIAAVRVLLSSVIAPYNAATLEDLNVRHPFRPPPSLPHTPTDHQHLAASPAVVFDRIKSFPQGTSCGTDVLRAQHLRDCLSGAVVAISDELVASITQRRLVSKVGAAMVGSSLGGYFDGLQFGVGVSGGGEAILHVVNRLIEDHGHVAGFSILLAWYLDDGTIVGDTLVVGKVLELILQDGPRYGLHLNVVKTEVYWPKDDPRSRLVGVFPPNIALPLQGVKLLGGPVSVDSNFSSELVMKRVAKTIMLMDAVAKINDPQSGTTFDDALHLFNRNLQTDFLSNPSEIVAPKLMKKMADIYVISSGLTMRFTEGGLNVNLKTFSSFEQFLRLSV